ncbi:hypothetical protein ACFYS8_36275 [Kitasatospora sp. NPDC004615]|uniref:hypothetical protein n=1 Tax=Kitasatospora sp. NPDC004615 TaxID=3364017 RepID=UPI0036CE9CD7
MSSIIALGSGGFATCATVYLYAGIRGKNRITVKKDNVPYWAFAIGTFSASAGSAFQQIAGIGTQIDQAFQGNNALGDWRTGATAALLTIVTFGFEAKPLKDSICGAVAPSLFAAAGGLWALPANFFYPLASAFVN